MKSGKLEIGVCCIEPSEPFIYWVNGKATIETLKQIEESLVDGYKSSIEIAYKEECNLKFEAVYIPEERQYGTGYSDIYILPGYFNMRITNKIPWELEEDNLK